MLTRPTKFSEVVGNTQRLRYLENKLKEGSLPNFIILSGISGVGKTTVAKILSAALNCEGLTKPCGTCHWCTANLDRIFAENKDTETIFHYKMTEDCTPDKMKEIVLNMKPSFLKEGQKKVLILDEAHRMNEMAQDFLLVDTEYLNPSVFVILMTTDTSKFKDTIMDRAFHLVFQALTPTEMKTVIKRDIHRRKLTLDNENLAVELLVNYSKGKPRKALQILNGIGSNKKVSLPELKEFVEYLDIQEVIPIIRSLKETSFLGIETIMNLNISSETQSNLVNLLIEAKRLQRGDKCKSLGFEETKELRSVLVGVEEQTLTRFLYKVAGIPLLTNLALLHAFLDCHADIQLLMSPPSIIQSDENIYSATHRTEPVQISKSVNTDLAPTLESLARSATILT